MVLRAPVGANKTVSSRSWKGPNDPKTLPRDMIHNYKSCWPTLGPYRYLRGAPKGPFGLRQGLTGIKALGARLEARFGPNCCRLVRLGWSHGYHTLWPGIGPFSWPPRAPKGPVLALNAPYGGPGGPRRVRRGHIWSQLPLIGLPGLESLYTTHFVLVLDLFLAPRGPKRACFGPKGPFWGSWRDSEGPREPGLVPTATGCCA